MSDDTAIPEAHPRIEVLGVSRPTLNWLPSFPSWRPRVLRSGPRRPIGTCRGHPVDGLRYHVASWQRVTLAERMHMRR